MTKQEFLNYKWSSKTRVKYEGKWYKISDIGFIECRLLMYIGVIGKHWTGKNIYYSQIKDIKH